MVVGDVVLLESGVVNLGLLICLAKTNGVVLRSLDGWKKSVSFRINYEMPVRLTLSLVP